jgi:hypothetical protein
MPGAKKEAVLSKGQMAQFREFIAERWTGKFDGRAWSQREIAEAWSEAHPKQPRNFRSISREIGRMNQQSAARMAGLVDRMTEGSLAFLQGVIDADPGDMLERDKDGVLRFKKLSEMTPEQRKLLSLRTTSGGKKTTTQTLDVGSKITAAGQVLRYASGRQLAKFEDLIAKLLAEYRDAAGLQRIAKDVGAIYVLMERYRHLQAEKQALRERVDELTAGESSEGGAEESAEE